MIPLFKTNIPPRDALHCAWDRILDSGYIAEGDEVVAFENEFGDYIDHHNCVAVNSCTSALHLALILSGAKPGTSVISTPMTAEPTSTAIAQTGATLIWADVDPANGNIDWSDVKRKVREDTVAIICVHYAGIPALSYDMWDIPDQISVIEDCAHALGAYWENFHVGTVMDHGCFSFQAIKHLTTIDGGMLICNDPIRARRLRFFGIDRTVSRIESDIMEPGYKYHMNNICAAMGRVQLQHIHDIINVHRANGAYYESQLSTIPGVTPAYYDSLSDPSYWLFTLLLDTQADRDSLARRLSAEGIGNGVVHKRNDLHSAFVSSKCELPGLDHFYSHMLHIPCGWWVSEEDRERIVEVIKGA